MCEGSQCASYFSKQKQKVKVGRAWSNSSVIPYAVFSKVMHIDVLGFDWEWQNTLVKESII